MENQQKRGFNHKNNDGKESFIYHHLSISLGTVRICLWLRHMQLQRHNLPLPAQITISGYGSMDPWAVSQLYPMTWCTWMFKKRVAGWFSSAIPTTCDVVGPLFELFPTIISAGVRTYMMGISPTKIGTISLTRDLESMMWNDICHHEMWGAFQCLSTASPIAMKCHESSQPNMKRCTVSLYVPTLDYKGVRVKLTH